METYLIPSASLFESPNVTITFSAAKKVYLNMFWPFTLYITFNKTSIINVLNTKVMMVVTVTVFMIPTNY